MARLGTPSPAPHRVGFSRPCSATWPCQCWTSTSKHMGRPTPRRGGGQGGGLSPVLSSLALSVLDEHIEAHGQASAPWWVRERRRRQGLPNYRIVRYADDFVVLVAGTRDDTETVREQVTVVLATIGLRLSAEKTTIAHIDEGFDFLGWRIQRHQQR